MTSPQEWASAAERILSTVAFTLVPELRLSVASEALRLFEGRGVTIGEPDDPEDDIVTGTVSTDDLTRAAVDVQRVLAEVLAHLDLIVSGEEDDFFRIEGHRISADCAIYFLRSNSVPPYAARMLCDRELCVVVHANPDLAANYNDFAHPLGVHTMRLRDIGSLTPERLRELADTVSAVRAAAELHDAADARDAQALLDLSQSADPFRIEEYASTRNMDAHFEVAVAKVMSPLVDGLVVLGSSFRGKPVPDGLMLLSHRAAIGTEVVSYDCKSKEDDFYGLAAGDVDQQVRYLEVLERLKKYGWRAPAVLLFTPSVDRDKFNEKTSKDYCQTLVRKGYGLRIIPARLVKRWYELCQGERVGSLSLHFDQDCFWGALMHLVLPGVTDDVRDHLLSNRAQQLRLMTLEEAELTWLAAFAQAGTAVERVAASLRETDPSGINMTAIERPEILRKFFAALRKPSASFADVRAATGLTDSAVRYLLACEGFHPRSAKDFGDHGVGALNRLRKEIGLVQLSQ